MLHLSIDVAVSQRKSYPVRFVMAGSDRQIQYNSFLTGTQSRF